MAANRCQWRSCCQFLFRSPDEASVLNTDVMLSMSMTGMRIRLSGGRPRPKLLGIQLYKFAQAETARGARWLKWLERESTDRKVRCSNTTSASRLLLSRFGQTDTLAIPVGGMAARHRKGATVERLSLFSLSSSTATNKISIRKPFLGEKAHALANRLPYCGQIIQERIETQIYVERSEWQEREFTI
ncbi:hypothetical protein T265_11557 [Opisthorchis viverrini]|uniref:Uncharacterized protein n=1 Tax=Opisthorchis viverrini TaxID=6198 RepID=A0A074Z943_OPIVI|nr:hypothetical protein T265_11557 [Opisthorchis viverrini]KER19745.1 hypothetical protein T265_11557 [Opisthorchis viverrini]